MADGLPTSPVLVGHSMGGFLVQMYLTDRSAPAAVLLASMPSQARRRVGVAVRAIRRHPLVAVRANTIGSTADLVNTPRLARDHFFSPHTPDSVVESCAALVGEESWGAPGFSVRLKPAKIKTPAPLPFSAPKTTGSLRTVTCVRPRARTESDRSSFPADTTWRCLNPAGPSSPNASTAG